jgi:hypothetical protein
MNRKLSLELDTLSVESFETSAPAAGAPGTVRAAEDESAAPDYFDCTCFNTCVCKTAYYWCGDGYATLYSCNYTHNESCAISANCTTS